MIVDLYLQMMQGEANKEIKGVNFMCGEANSEKKRS